MPDHTDPHTSTSDGGHDRGAALAAPTAELQQLLLDTEGVTEFLDEVASYAAARFGAGLSCGITLDRGNGYPITVGSSDARALDLDEVQYGHHHGPCLTAMHDQVTVSIVDLATDDRWGEYRIDALAHGIGSALSVCLRAGAGVEGALNLYAATPGAFDAGTQVRAEALGAEVSRALRLAVRLGDQVRLTVDLQTAIASRSVIDRAIGIIMAQNRCTADAGFEILRAASNHRNIKLRDVAATIVTRIGGSPTSDPPPPPRPSPPPRR